MLACMKLENFLCFDHITFDLRCAQDGKAAKTAVLFGENGAGKTCLLAGLAFLKQCVFPYTWTADTYQTDSDPFSFSLWRRYGCTEPSRAVFTFVLEDVRTEYQLEFDDHLRREELVFTKGYAADSGDNAGEKTDCGKHESHPDFQTFLSLNLNHNGEVLEIVPAGIPDLRCMDLIYPLVKDRTPDQTLLSVLADAISKDVLLKKAIKTEYSWLVQLLEFAASMNVQISQSLQNAVSACTRLETRLDPVPDWMEGRLVCNDSAGQRYLEQTERLLTAFLPAVQPGMKKVFYKTVPSGTNLYY